MLFLMLFAFLGFIGFPDRSDSIFNNPKNRNSMRVESSGSLGLYYSKKCHLTYPNSTISNEKTNEWCSNVISNGNGNPWISYYLPNRKMKIKGYSIRNGCCYHSCCCTDENGNNEPSFYCCCRLYSFSLQGSNDNVTWTILHKVEQKRDFYYCKYETYEFEMSEPFTYLKIQLDERFPECPFCMTINEVDFYGEVLGSYDIDDQDYEDTDESISIIGKIKSN